MRSKRVPGWRETAGNRRVNQRSAQLCDGRVEPGQADRKHAPGHQLPSDAHRWRVFPGGDILWIQPDELWIGCDDPAHPGAAWLAIPVLDAAARLRDLMRTHRCITNENDPVIASIGAQQLLRRCDGGDTPAVVLPYALVHEVVEVEMLQMLELAACGGEQLIADEYVLVHRAPDIQKQQHLDGVVPLRHQLQIEQTRIPGGRIDRAVEVELLGGALASEPAQAA